MAQQKQRAINAFYEAPFAKRRKPIHLNLAGVYFEHAPNIFTHTSTALFYTFEIVSDAHIHTHGHVCTQSKTHTHRVSIPLLFFVLVAVYYRSQLCNCVEAAYFLSLLPLSLPVYAVLSYYLAEKVMSLLFDPYLKQK